VPLRSQPFPRFDWPGGWPARCRPDDVERLSVGRDERRRVDRRVLGANGQCQRKSGADGWGKHGRRACGIGENRGTELLGHAGCGAGGSADACAGAIPGTRPGPGSCAGTRPRPRPGSCSYTRPAKAVACSNSSAETSTAGSGAVRGNCVGFVRTMSRRVVQRRRPPGRREPQHRLQAREVHRFIERRSPGDHGNDKRQLGHSDGHRAEGVEG